MLEAKRVTHVYLFYRLKLSPLLVFITKVIFVGCLILFIA